MDYEPTPKQTLLLWDLLGRGGAAAQADVPFAVKVVDRDALERAGFLKKIKVGRTLWLSVEEKGWAWAGDHLDASLAVPAAPKKTSTKAPAKPPAPPKAPKVPTLQNWLTHLKGFLSANHKALSDLLPHASPPESPSPPDKKPTGRGSKAKQPAQAAITTLESIEAEVRSAVAALQGAPQRDGVRLSALRKHLAHLDRTALDKALLTLFTERKIKLVNLDNPRDIEAERDAAISYKGQLLQVLWL